VSAAPGLSRTADLPALRALWRQAFGDPDEVIGQFFTDAWTPEGMFVLRDGERLLAMAAWFPATLCEGRRGWQAAYLYAVATDESARHRGCCRQLLDFASGWLTGRGVKCLCLVPGSEELYRFYEKLGYARLFTRGLLTCPAVPTDGTASPAGAPEYLAEREALLAGRTYLSYPVPVLEYQRKLAGLGGGGLFLLSRGGRTGCACAASDGGRAVIYELLWPGDPAEGAAMVLAALGAKTAEVRVPEGGEPFGMIRWLIPQPPALSAGYLGLAFD